MKHVWGIGEVHTGCSLGYLMERVHLEYLDVGGIYNTKMDLQEMGGMSSTGFIWIRIAVGGGCL